MNEAPNEILRRLLHGKSLSLRGTRSDGPKKNPPTQAPLKQLIVLLQEEIRNKSLTNDKVLSHTEALARFGYQYEHDNFPALTGTKAFTTTGSSSPSSLAEALLWKLGRWQSYKNFSKYFADDASEPKSTDVVFYAFARHLKKESNPIYDQHVLRALWAIDSGLSEEQNRRIKSFLMDGNGKWKVVGSGIGLNPKKCYILYCERLSEIGSFGISLRTLDLLFMPLGQAIKKTVENYEAFRQICGLKLKQ